MSSFTPKQAEMSKSALCNTQCSENGSGKISLFTNEVPVRRASHLHSFNYYGEMGGWEIPTVQVQPAVTQVMQSC